MGPEFIDVKENIAKHVAIVFLDRPPVNALGRQIREEFVDAFASLQDRDDIRVIVLSAHGDVFSAGADIKEKNKLGEVEGDQARANRLTRESFFCIVDSTKPVIAAVNGPALGAGFVMAAGCDMIFAAEEASFGMPEIDVGLGGGASFLLRILPRSKVRRLVLTGERMAASDLVPLGAVEAVLPKEDVLPVTLETASRIAAKSPTAVQTIRKSFRTVEHLSLQEGFRFEQEYTAWLSKTDDAAEARLAFLEKRSPEF